MKRLQRAMACVVPAAILLCACNAILGIGDLTPSDRADGGGEPDANVNAVDAATVDANAPADSGGPAVPLCSDSPNADPCLVVVDQSGGALYPTWRITSIASKHSIGVSVVPPTLPVYVDAGDGTVMETHSELVWQTKTAAADGTVDFDAGRNACAALGAGWRLPARIEMASVHARNEVNGPPYGNCMPSAFDLGSGANVWTSTEERDAGNHYIAHETYVCGVDPWDGPARVRCVKGEPKPATFLVRKSADVVWARETNLDWERTGVIVKSYAEAKAHCDARNARVPVTEEAMSIIDTRRTSVFDPALFATPDGGMRAMITSTTFSKEDGGVTAYECLATLADSVASIDVVPTEGDSTADLLVRCVKEHTD